MYLSKGTTTSLEAPLNNTIKQLDNNNVVTACNNLGAFLNQVNVKENNGQLTHQQATELIQQTTSIQQTLGCSTPSASPPSPSETTNGDDTLGSLVNNSLKSFGDLKN